MAQPQQQLQVALEFLKTNYRLDTFQEPRGVMRILQLIFSIWGFFACNDFAITFSQTCNEAKFTKYYVIDYPFDFSESICPLKVNNKTDYYIGLESSSGAQFFVATAVLSLLYAIFIIFVYAYLDEMYKSKPEFPMADFALTGGLAFFWLIGSIGLNSGGNALKKAFDENYIASQCFQCDPKISSFSDLNIALMIGFLNFFLWASDLWFLYKETIWFQQRSQIMNQQMYGQQQFGGPQQFGQPQQFDQPQYETQPQQQDQFGQQQFGQQQFGGYEQQQQQQFGQQQFGQPSYGQPQM